jgi:hypothetical protein
MWNPPVHDANTQYIEETEDIPSLSQQEVNCLQHFGSTLLYYTRAVDLTLIMPVNVLASEQKRATTETVDNIIKLINYCTTHP